MPVHDWSKIDAGVFHDFHHAWIEEIKRALNAGVLPAGYYALAEQRAAGLGPDVLTLQVTPRLSVEPAAPVESGGGAAVAMIPPKIRLTAETDLEYYRRKQNRVAIRHVSGHELVAVIEIVSRGNKSSRGATAEFVSKAAEVLHQGIHLLILDLHPPGPRDPRGIHALIWEEISGEQSLAPAKPLTLAAYDAGAGVRAYVETIAVGDPLTDMPLFLLPGRCVHVPLEATYTKAVDAMPRWWRDVLERMTKAK